MPLITFRERMVGPAASAKAETTSGSAKLSDLTMEGQFSRLWAVSFTRAGSR